MDFSHLNLLDEMKPLASKVMHYSDLCADAMLNHKENAAVILGYLNYAASYVTSLRAIFISNSEILKDLDDEKELLDKFELFASEVLSAVAELESYAGALNFYKEFEKAYNDSKFGNKS
ncbi:MAG: hypothetical protein NC320_00895 [Clostridium sp.]|nr:hypothetical protein [Clostridium sp.]